MKTLRTFLSLALIVLLSSWRPSEENTVKWLTFEEAIVLHEKQPKKILIDLYTDWCGWCKVMDKKTYSQQQIFSYINKNFYPVKFNAEQKESVEFRGNTFNYVSSGNRGVHELAVAFTQNRLSYPTTIFIDEDLKIIQPIGGYLKPDQMEPILKYIGGDYFKTTKWEDFKKNHKSSL